MIYKEKYKDKLFDWFCKERYMPAIVNGEYKECSSTKCSECELFDLNLDCTTVFNNLLNSKVKEIDWTKVPVDTPVYVRDENDHPWRKRHFKKFDAHNNEYPYRSYDDGRTSWSSDSSEQVCGWKQCKLAEGVDCSEWYKN